ncbi:hypothetical protein OJAV_G00179680 [Oryzias javanicus]|uniref:Uncharacterized protein n=1 Tax=Oryzias javanicus TaxID=123683 RepID=A0A3S2MJ17_ORYJA|nr:hypothetical protein OJAV_G00179680 [Oryzias javanicus]
MPFCKRTVLPKCVSRRGGLFAELTDVCGFSLGSVLRQLSDLSRLCVSLLEELEGELRCVCRRCGALEARLSGLQRRAAEMISGPFPGKDGGRRRRRRRRAHLCELQAGLGTK